jgi:hypothetical protein
VLAPGPQSTVCDTDPSLLSCIIDRPPLPPRACTGSLVHRQQRHEQNHQSKYPQDRFNLHNLFLLA